MNPRIKINPQTGQVVVWEPERTPKAPWFSIYAPDRQPGDAGQFLFTEDEVKDWPDWGPVDSPRETTPEETVIPAKDVKIGMLVSYRGTWELVRDTGYGDVMQRRLWLGERKRPTTFTPYEILAVRTK